MGRWGTRCRRDEGRGKGLTRGDRRLLPRLERTLSPRTAACRAGAPFCRLPAQRKRTAADKGLGALAALLLCPWGAWLLPGLGALSSGALSGSGGRPESGSLRPAGWVSLGPARCHLWARRASRLYGWRGSFCPPTSRPQSEVLGRPKALFPPTTLSGPRARSTHCPLIPPLTVEWLSLCLCGCPQAPQLLG